MWPAGHVVERLILDRRVAQSERDSGCRIDSEGGRKEEEQLIVRLPRNRRKNRLATNEAIATAPMSRGARGASVIPHPI